MEWQNSNKEENIKKVTVCAFRYKVKKGTDPSSLSFRWLFLGKLATMSWGHPINLESHGKEVRLLPAAMWVSQLRRGSSSLKPEDDCSAGRHLDCNQETAQVRTSQLSCSQTPNGIWDNKIFLLYKVLNFEVVCYVAIKKTKQYRFFHFKS